GKIKSLNLSWKEPVTRASTGGPLLTADGLITVTVGEQDVHTRAELALDDLRGQATEWQLALPPGATVDARGPAGLQPALLAPDKTTPWHRLRLKEPTNERIQVVAQVRQPRPGTAGPPALNRFPVGPFAVPGAFRQQGTILVKTIPEWVRGQRLTYHRQGDVQLRDLTEEQRRDQVVAAFKYTNMPAPERPEKVGKPPPAKPGKQPSFGPVPLEIELAVIKGVIETRVDHTLKLQKAEHGWQVLAVTRIHALPLYTGIDSLDVQLPPLRADGASVFATVPPAPFPVIVPWAGLAWGSRAIWPARAPLEYECEEKGSAAPVDLVPAGTLRRSRIKLGRLQAKEFTVTLTGTYALSAGA